MKPSRKELNFSTFFSVVIVCVFFFPRETGDTKVYKNNSRVYFYLIFKIKKLFSNEKIGKRR